jgi:DNA-binding NarL/FixJ family response regulator
LKALATIDKSLTSSASAEAYSAIMKSATFRQAGLSQDQENAGTDPARRRLLLVEDHPVVSRGLKELLNYEPDLQVCGIAEDATLALSQLAEFKPDLILLDLSLKGMSGMDLLREVKSRNPRQLVLILSMHDEVVYAPRALRAGAAGYVTKLETTETLVRAIRKVLAGGIYLSDALENRLIQRLVRTGETYGFDPLETLTDRELEIFHLMGDGHRNHEIARLLAISVKTLESHRSNMRSKLGLKNASELVHRAIESHRAFSKTQGQTRHLLTVPPSPRR